MYQNTTGKITIVINVLHNEHNKAYLIFFQIVLQLNQRFYKYVKINQLSILFLCVQETWRLERKNRNKWSWLPLPLPFFSIKYSSQGARSS